MIVHLVLALGVVVFLFYVFCHSPPAQRTTDELFYDPLEESIRGEYRMEDTSDE